MSSEAPEVLLSRLRSTVRSDICYALQTLYDSMPVYRASIASAGLPLLFQILSQRKADAEVAALTIDVIDCFIGEVLRENDIPGHVSLASNAFFDADKSNAMFMTLLDTLDPSDTRAELKRPALSIINTLSIANTDRVIKALKAGPIGLEFLVQAVSSDLEVVSRLAISVLTHVTFTNSTLLQLLAEKVSFKRFHQANAAFGRSMLLNVQRLLEQIHFRLEAEIPDVARPSYTTEQLLNVRDYARLLCNLSQNAECRAVIVKLPGFLGLLGQMTAIVLQLSTEPCPNLAIENAAMQAQRVILQVLVRMVAADGVPMNAYHPWPAMLEELWSARSQPVASTARDLMAANTSLIEQLVQLAFRSWDRVSGQMRADCLLVVAASMLNKAHLQEVVAHQLCCMNPVFINDAAEVHKSALLLAPDVVVTPSKTSNGIPVYNVITAAVAHALSDQTTVFRDACRLFTGASVFGFDSMQRRLGFLTDAQSAPPLPVPPEYAGTQLSFVASRVRRQSPDVETVAAASVLWKAFHAALTVSSETAERRQWVAQVCADILAVVFAPGRAPPSRKLNVVPAVDAVSQVFCARYKISRLPFRVEHANADSPVLLGYLTNCLTSEHGMDASLLANLLTACYLSLVDCIDDVRSMLGDVHTLTRLIATITTRTSASSQNEKQLKILSILLSDLLASEATNSDAWKGLQKELLDAETQDVFDRNTWSCMVKHVTRRLAPASSGDEDSKVMLHAETVRELEAKVRTLEDEKRGWMERVRTLEIDEQTRRKEEETRSARLQAEIDALKQALQQAQAKTPTTITSAPSSQSLSLLKQDLQQSQRTIAEQATLIADLRKLLATSNTRRDAFRDAANTSKAKLDELQAEHDDLLVLLAVKDQHIELLCDEMHRMGLSAAVDSIAADIEAALDAAAQNPVTGRSPHVPKKLFDGTASMKAPERPVVYSDHHNESFVAVKEEPKVTRDSAYDWVVSPPETDNAWNHNGAVTTQSVSTTLAPSSREYAVEDSSVIKPLDTASSLQDTFIALSPPTISSGKSTQRDMKDAFLQDVEVTPIQEPNDAESRNNITDAFGLHASKAFEFFKHRVGASLTQSFSQFTQLIGNNDASASDEYVNDDDSYESNPSGSRQYAGHDGDECPQDDDYSHAATHHMHEAGIASTGGPMWTNTDNNQDTNNTAASSLFEGSSTYEPQQHTTYNGPVWTNTASETIPKHEHSGYMHDYYAQYDGGTTTTVEAEAPSQTMWTNVYDNQLPQHQQQHAYTQEEYTHAHTAYSTGSNAYDNQHNTTSVPTWTNVLDAYPTTHNDHSNSNAWGGYDNHAAYGESAPAMSDNNTYSGMHDTTTNTQWAQHYPATTAATEPSTTHTTPATADLFFQTHADSAPTGWPSTTTTENYPAHLHKDTSSGDWAVNDNSSGSSIAGPPQSTTAAVATTTTTTHAPSFLPVSSHTPVNAESFFAHSTLSGGDTAHAHANHTDNVAASFAQTKSPGTMRSWFG